MPSEVQGGTSAMGMTAFSLAARTNLEATMPTRPCYANATTTPHLLGLCPQTSLPKWVLNSISIDNHLNNAD